MAETRLCGRGMEDFISLYNVSENQILSHMNGEEYNQHYGFSISMHHPFFMRLPKDYMIPLTWPTRRDVLWTDNVNIIKG